jgi:hypothetical protein
MQLLAIIAFSVVAAITATPEALAGEDYRIQARSIPLGFESEAAFLDVIKWPVEPHEAFDAKNAPEWNLEALSQFIPDSGIDFTDVNRRGKKHFSRETILGSLKKRKGQPFVTFSHLSHIYSVPYKQYSSLEFKRVGATTVVRVATWYRLTFRHSTHSAQLLRCDYLQLEGE